MTSAPRTLRETQAAFLDRVMRTGGRDPGPAVLDLPERRLAVYRDMVLGGYRMMLTFVHTESLRLLAHELESAPAHDGARDKDALIANMVASNPSRTHSTRMISDRWMEFLPAAYPDLVARRPELPDLMRIERAELRAHYHPDDPGRGATQADGDRMRGASVDEFLATRVLRAPSASLLRLGHPAATVQDALREHRFPPPPAPAAQCVAVSRSPLSLLPVVRVHEGPGTSLLDLLGGLQDGGSGDDRSRDDKPRDAVRASGAGDDGTPLETLAERWLGALPPEVAASGDDALFRTFGDTVLRLLGDGVLRLSP